MSAWDAVFARRWGATHTRVLEAWHAGVNVYGYGLACQATLIPEVSDL